VFEHFFIDEVACLHVERIQFSGLFLFRYYRFHIATVTFQLKSDAEGRRPAILPRTETLSFVENHYISDFQNIIKLS
jgi:hypothetical protein